jgi:hypothetical protein
MSGEMINLYDSANTNSITTNIIPGLINSEDYVGTNGHNYLTNISGENGLGTNSTVLAYDFYVNNTISTYQYDIFNLVYRVSSTLPIYDNGYGPGPATEVYLLVDGNVQSVSEIPSTSGAWMSFNNSVYMTPGVHKITVAMDHYGLTFGSMQISLSNGAVIQTINTNKGTAVNMENYLVLGPGDNVQSASVANGSEYNGMAEWVDYAIDMPGVTGGPATTATLDFWYGAGEGISFETMAAGSTTFSAYTSVGETTGNALVHEIIPVTVYPGLQDLRIYIAGALISNLRITN